jgi:transposase
VPGVQRVSGILEYGDRLRLTVCGHWADCPAAIGRAETTIGFDLVHDSVGSSFEAIAYLLRAGCQRKALPTGRLGSASTIRRRLLKWRKAGMFEALCKAWLTAQDDLEGLAWRGQSIGVAIMQAPPAPCAFPRWHGAHRRSCAERGNLVNSRQPVPATA